MTVGRRAWGFDFELESDDPALRTAFEWCFADLPEVETARNTVMATRCLRADADDVERFDVWLRRPGQPEEDCGQGWPASEAMSLLTAVVNGQARRSAALRSVLHAAVFGGPAGCVVLCGQTGVGKSTLATGAALRGWTHLSDDLAMIDVAARTVTQYARPLMVREGAMALLGEQGTLAELRTPPEYDRFVGGDRFLPATALGARLAHDPQPLVALGFLERGPVAELRPMTRAATLQALTVHSANLPDRGAEAFDELVRLAEVVPGYAVTIGEVSSTLNLLAPMVGQPIA